VVFRFRETGVVSERRGGARAYCVVRKRVLRDGLDASPVGGAEPRRDSRERARERVGAGFETDTRALASARAIRVADVVVFLLSRTVHEPQRQRAREERTHERDAATHHRLRDRRRLFLRRHDVELLLRSRLGVRYFLRRRLGGRVRGSRPFGHLGDGGDASEREERGEPAERVVFRARHERERIVVV
jgi:hypothetical protein